MIIIPAIDLKDGRCVRLRQGRADESITYSEDPVGMARRWVDAGAPYLHVVDLDGAFQGRPVHTDVVTAIAQAISIPVEVGGGLRTDADIRRVLDGGATRAIIGTRALAAPDELRKLADTFGPRLVVGIDARNGRVQVRGWVETTDVQAADLARTAADAGVRTLIYTDTATDGMLRGPNTAAVDALCAAVDIDVIASGGVSRVEDVTALKALNCPNLIGVIVGKALYEGTVTLEDLMRDA